MGEIEAGVRGANEEYNSIPLVVTYDLKQLSYSLSLPVNRTEEVSGEASSNTASNTASNPPSVKRLLFFFRVLSAKREKDSYVSDGLAEVVRRFREWKSVSEGYEIRDFSKEMLTLNVKVSWVDGDKKWDSSKTYDRVVATFFMTKGVALVRLSFPPLKSLGNSSKEVISLPPLYLYDRGIEALARAIQPERIDEIFVKQKTIQAKENLFR